MDVFIWKPLLIWSQRFRQDATSNEDEEDLGLFLNLPKTIASRLSFMTEPLLKIFFALSFPVRWVFREIIFPLFWDLPFALASSVAREVVKPIRPVIKRTEGIREAIGYFALGFFVIFGAFYIYHWLKGPMPLVLHEIPISIFYSTLRILTALSISFAAYLFYLEPSPRAFGLNDDCAVRGIASGNGAISTHYFSRGQTIWRRDGSRNSRALNFRNSVVRAFQCDRRRCHHPV